MSLLKVVTQSEWDLLMKRLDSLEKMVFKAPSTEVEVAEKPKAKRASRLPEDWLPSRETVQKMMDELGVGDSGLLREHHKFMDHFVAAPGQRGVKLDWDRTWCNWMRRAAEQGTLRAVGRSVSPMDEKVSGWQEMGRAAATQ